MKVLSRTGRGLKVFLSGASILSLAYPAAAITHLRAGDQRLHCRVSLMVANPAPTPAFSERVFWTPASASERLNWLPLAFRPVGEVQSFLEESRSFRHLVTSYLSIFSASSLNARSPSSDIYRALIENLENNGNPRIQTAHKISEYLNLLIYKFTKVHPDQSQNFAKAKFEGHVGRFVESYLRLQLTNNESFARTKGWALADADKIPPRLQPEKLTRISLFSTQSDDVLTPNAPTRAPLLFEGDLFRDSFRLKLGRLERLLANAEGLASEIIPLATVHFEKDISPNAEEVLKSEIQKLLEVEGDWSDVQKFHQSLSLSKMENWQLNAQLQKWRVILFRKLRAKTMELIGDLSQISQILHEEYHRVVLEIPEAEAEELSGIKVAAPLVMPIPEVERERLVYIARYRILPLILELQSAELPMEKMRKTFGLSLENEIKLFIDLRRIRELGDMAPSYQLTATPEAGKIISP